MNETREELSISSPSHDDAISRNALRTFDESPHSRNFASRHYLSSIRKHFRSPHDTGRRQRVIREERSWSTKHSHSGVCMVSRRAGVSSGYFEQYYWQTVAAAVAAARETWRRVVTHIGVALVRQESVPTAEGHDEPGGMVRKGLRGEHSWRVREQPAGCTAHGNSGRPAG